MDDEGLVLLPACSCVADSSEGLSQHQEPHTLKQMFLAVPLSQLNLKSNNNDYFTENPGNEN